MNSALIAHWRRRKGEEMSTAIRWVASSRSKSAALERGRS